MLSWICRPSTIRLTKMVEYQAIDYRQECDPPLEGDDRIWAEELLKAAGKR